MQKLLNKIFGAARRSGQLYVAGIGFFVGLILIMLSLHLYLQMSEVLNPQKEEYSEYIVLSKKISIGNTFNVQTAEFSPEEIADLQGQAFADKVHPFISNQFEILAYSDGQLGFMTEMFFEAVSKEAIDQAPYTFEWKEGDAVVPVIISQEILNLYNFGYALSKGLPKIPRSAAGLLKVKLRLRGAKGETLLEGKIVGFSERIASVLVPESFMNWANQNIGSGKAPKPSRLMLKLKNPSDSRLIPYLEEKNIQIGQEVFNMNKVFKIVYAAVSLVNIMGVLFILLSFVIFTSNFRVILAESKAEVQLLTQLGCSPKILSAYLFRSFGIFMLLLSLAAFSSLWGLSLWLDNYLIQSGLEITPGIKPLSLLAGLLFVAAAILFNFISVKRLINKYI